MTTKQKIALYKKFLKVTKGINAFSLPWLANSAQYFCNTYAMIKLSNNFLPVNETVLSVKPDMLAAKRDSSMTAMAGVGRSHHCCRQTKRPTCAGLEVGVAGVYRPSFLAT